MTLRRPDKVHALTSIRFFAAFWIVLYHSRLSENPAVHSDTFVTRALSISLVPLFFMLSGYILAIVYLQGPEQISVKRFFVARFARIYPLFLITLIADTPHFYWTRLDRLSVLKAATQTSFVFVGNLLMLQAWHPTLRGIDFPNWSLSAEFLFYLAFPFIGTKLWQLKKSSLWLAALVLWIGAQLGIYWLTPHLGNYVSSYNPILHVPTFLLGILLARWRILGHQKLGEKRAPDIRVYAALAIVVLGVAATIYWLHRLPNENVNHGLLAPLFALLIWLLSENSNLPARVLSAQWLTILGQASFGLYLIHIPVLNLYKRLHWMEVSALYPTYLLACLGLSLFSLFFIENPSRSWILKYLHTRPKEMMEMASDAQ